LFGEGHLHDERLEGSWISAEERKSHFVSWRSSGKSKNSRTKAIFIARRNLCEREILDRKRRDEGLLMSQREHVGGYYNNKKGKLNSK